MSETNTMDLSRGDAEALALLDALDHGGGLGAVTSRLGLAPGLEAAVGAALVRLVALGLAEMRDDGIVVSEMGRARLGGVRGDQEALALPGWR